MLPIAMPPLPKIPLPFVPLLPFAFPLPPMLRVSTTPSMFPLISNGADVAGVPVPVVVAVPAFATTAAAAAVPTGSAAAVDIE